MDGRWPTETRPSSQDRPYTPVLILYYLLNEQVEVFMARSHPLTLRGILGALARRMRPYGGVEYLVSLVGNYRTIHQWAGNKRSISTASTAKHLQLLCSLWGIQPLIYQGSRRRSPETDMDIPPGHLVVSAPDGWWLLPGETPWEERKAYAGDVSLLLPSSLSPEGFDIPRFDSLPDAVSKIIEASRDLSPETLRAHLHGALAALTIVEAMAPTHLLKAMRQASSATTTSDGIRWLQSSLQDLLQG